MPLMVCFERSFTIVVKSESMIPPFDDNGNLPPGIHWAEWSEFKERFGTTPKRLRMIQGLQTAMEQLKAARCRIIYINGSFVTNKTEPGDFIKVGTMIKNEHSYHVTKSWAEKFERAIAAVRQNEEKKINDPDGWQLLQESYQSQLESLRDEIAEYETLNAHDTEQPVVLKIPEINELSNVMIQARIALKISQKELAALSGIIEEKVITYEEKDYQNASFVDVLAVSDALGIKIKQGAFVAELYDFYKEKLAAIRESERPTPQISASP